jgi:hypothetical protein
MSEVRRQEEAKRAADEKGLVIVRPESNELFVDIDDEVDLAAFHASREILGDLVESFRLTRSPSGRPGRYHARVRLTRDIEDDFERIALQAILGSDRKREVLSWVRAARGEADATIFFETPGAIAELSKWPY